MGSGFVKIHLQEDNLSQSNCCRIPNGCLSFLERVSVSGNMQIYRRAGLIGVRNTGPIEADDANGEVFRAGAWSLRLRM